MEKKLKQQPSSCLKVVLYGPESTGKTTLAEQLAQHYNTCFVPEYAREYAIAQFKKGKTLTKDDVLPIAIGQMKMENEKAKKANQILICDTNLLETKVYAAAYFPNYSNKEINTYALKNNYNLYFLTYIDMLWVADGIRDKPNHRKQMFAAFKDELEKNKINYVLLKGTIEERLKIAKYHIDKLVEKKI